MTTNPKTPDSPPDSPNLQLSKPDFVDTEIVFPPILSKEQIELMDKEYEDMVRKACFVFDCSSLLGDKCSQ